MAMILPKGIVVNSPDIEGQIERIDREPLEGEEIARFWKVYTTTGRRLRDPTAERLENYWWRIWGSRKRELKGATVARLFANISDGESFVPLRSAVQRDEGSPPTARVRSVISSASTTALTGHQPSTTSTTSPSSSSKPPIPMPPPILKKSKGSLTTGPRPTARFVSPHDSEVDSPSPISPTNSHVVVQPPSRAQSPDSHQLRYESKRLAPVSATKKKSGFVASTKATRKRPLIVRRPSSQTSQSSTDSVPRASEYGQSEDIDEESPVDSVEKKEPVQTSKFQENFSPVTSNSISPRKKSGRPAPVRRVSPRKPVPTSIKKGDGNKEGLARERVALPGPSSDLQPKSTGQKVVPLTKQESEELEVQKTLLAEFNSNLRRSSLKTTAQMPSIDSQISEKSRSKSDGEEGRRRELADNRLLPLGARSIVGLAPDLSPVTAEIAEPTGFQANELETNRFDKGKGRDLEEVRRTEMFVKRPVPNSLPGSEADSIGGPLSRSRSQLTMLLEKDRARMGDNKKDDRRRDRSRDDRRRGMR